MQTVCDNTSTKPSIFERKPGLDQKFNSIYTELKPTLTLKLDPNGTENNNTTTTLDDYTYAYACAHTDADSSADDDDDDEDFVVDLSTGSLAPVNLHYWNNIHSITSALNNL
ncbi:hypothetical protein Kpol_1073p23 [Vanderwaltozyma polyspora DSM 70294]|uniref:Uncharacterized protein n=1 Tax=Vanderwaltozyma polyspora (strain ATCC 22028 / DSM 70294 / BCRC 21397 / CBS 2163 / NBRC 10782 / NRRL Y-8283 / UCD 57-17) TaxID=436907 RepID=A7TPT4_VANPO|nr:uncharacterized protein Kpol_1073p23 [Vanderwaltozyma polyspora DSM 70294]EDO15735.1 hypothetical protein Kpol_1073p23 [Vanderwaltozyma polyspora DSM 70294]